MREIWKPITDYPNYLVSNKGRIRNKKTKRVLKTFINQKGYVIVSLSRNGKGKSFRVHRLVAREFVANPEGYLEVNHLDCNRSNNYSTNLVWCSREQNINYGSRSLKQAQALKIKHIFENLAWE
jgi:hypothetical protein